MSNIYILEPPTLGKVLLKTTVGDIKIELWSKETPKACRNFVQLCMEDYYNGTIFHRVIPGFIAEGGDPTGEGTGGESIYGEPFKDEFHQRLKFVRRGLVAMSNAGKDDNGSQFFFTLGATPELQNKHTIFGKVVDDTIFNVLKLEQGLIKDERPTYPHQIIKTEVLSNPFLDIVPRVKPEKKTESKKKEKIPGVKNFKLLSFGAEAEEDEEENVKVNEIYAGKSKSIHDAADDPKLSSKTINENEKKGEKENEEDEGPSTQKQLENIRKKLKSEKQEIKKILAAHKHHEDDSDDEITAAKRRKLEEVRKEIESVKKDYHKNKLKKTIDNDKEKKEENEKTITLEEYKNEYDNYKDKKKALPKKGAGREEFTLSMLAKFKNKLNSVKEKKIEEGDGGNESKSDEEDVDNDESWMSHKLKFNVDAPTLAKDANTKDDDWYEIYDPRNPISKRRRGEAIYKETKK